MVIRGAGQDGCTIAKMVLGPIHEDLGIRGEGQDGCILSQNGILGTAANVRVSYNICCEEVRTNLRCHDHLHGIMLFSSTLQTS